MAESFSVKAILSAKDSGFSSTLKNAMSTTDSLASKLKSGFGIGIFQGMGQQAFSALSNGARELVSEINSSNTAWKTFEGNMAILGKGEKEVNSVKKTLQDYAQTTIYSSSDMASSYAQLAAVGIKSADKLVTGFGGLAGAAENPAQAMKTLSQQGVQMAAKSAVAWQDFKLMLEQTPAGMAAVAKHMGMTTSELVTAVQDGEISTKKFFSAVEAVGNSKGFTKLATEYKSVDQAMDGLKETIGNKLMPSFDALSKGGISVISKLIDKIGSIDGQKLADKVTAGVSKIEAFFAKCQPYVDAFKEAFSGVGTEVGGAFKAVKDSLAELQGEFGSTENVEGFKGVMTSVADVIKTVANFCTEHSDTIAKLIKLLPKIAVGMAAFKVAKTVAPFITTFASGIGKIASKVGGGLASKLLKTSTAQKTVGTTSATSGAQMLNAAKSYALMGAAVLMIAAGFALLAFSAISLANAGGGAIAVMAGLVVALVGLGVGMAFLLKSLAPMSAQLMPVATAFLAMGAAVLLISAGFALLAYSAISLANAGGAAIAVMVGMVATIALLAVGAAALGTALTAGAVGFVAFGAAVLMVGAGFALIGVSALLAASALSIIASILPTITAHGTSGAVAIAALGAGLLAFGAGALVAGAACLVLGAGLIVAGAGALVLAVGVAALAAGIAVAAVGMMLAAAGLALLNLALPATIQNGAAASASMLALGAGLLVMGAGALVASAGVIALGAGMLVASAGALAFGAGMTAASAGSLILAAALAAVNSSMKTISKNAKSTQKSLESMNDSVSAVESGLDALGNKAKSAISKVTKAFDDSADKAKSSGQKVGTGFTQGMQTGLNKAPVVARTVTVHIAAVLMAGRSSAYSAGAFISIGFAQGMQSQLGAIRSAAAQMAAAADKALRAKAKIHSPSKVFYGSGDYCVDGFVNSLKDGARRTWKAAEELFNIPQVATPDLAMAYSGELSADYEYSRNARYVISVPLNINGREVAKATVDDMQDELDKKQTRANRKRGKV